MPGIIWQFADHPFLRESYILPPVRYPDDKRWVKIGADHDRDVAIPDVESMHTYMTSAGSAATAEALSDLINRLIPALCGQARRTKPCLLTYTSSGYPTIDELERNWFVAAGGCGKSAKSSVQLGRMAADLVLEDRWDANYERTLFRSSTHGSRSI
jgi:sarcosine oxidase